MRNEKLTKLRNNIRHYVPEIIVGTTVVVGLGALVWLVKDAQRLDLGLAVDKDMLKHMVETGDGILFQLDEGNFYVKQVDW